MTVFDYENKSIVEVDFWEFVASLLNRQEWVFSSKDEEEESIKVAGLSDEDLEKVFHAMIPYTDIPREYSMQDLLDIMSKDILHFFHHIKNPYAKECMAMGGVGTEYVKLALQHKNYLARNYVPLEFVRQLGGEGFFFVYFLNSREQRRYCLYRPAYPN